MDCQCSKTNKHGNCKADFPCFKEKISFSFRGASRTLCSCGVQFEFVTELTIYGETLYERCTTENHSEVLLYNFPQQEIITSQTVPNTDYELSTQIICALSERYSDMQLQHNMLQNRIEISHLVQRKPDARMWHRSSQMERTKAPEYRFNYTGQQKFSIFEICWEWLVPSAQGPATGYTVQETLFPLFKCRIVARKLTSIMVGLTTRSYCAHN